MTETAAIGFGPFRLDAAHRTLWRGEVSVPLSSRAFDILLLLVENRGRVVTKDEIMTVVWRGMIVEENNLAVQVSALRRALAEGCETPLIQTVSGQGYRFIGDIAAPAPVEPAPAAPAAPAVATPLPAAPPPAAPALGRIWWFAAAGVAAVAAALLFRPAQPPAPPAAPQPAPPPRLSIAVLPFRDLSDDRCCDYLADAISDDITTDLSHIPGSVVIARESSDAFRGRALPTADIGRSLNVRYLLEGSLRAVEGQLFINAQLIEAASGGHLWAERFTVPRAQLGAAQTSIVQRMASALDVKLVDIEGSRAPGPESADALDLFLRARSTLDRGDSLAAMSQAQALLEQALAKQPDFAPALAELAWLLPRKASLLDPAAEADIAEARRVVVQALKYAPNSALALAARGALLSYDERCDEARPSFEAALATEPDNLPAQTGLMVCLMKLGQFEPAVARLKDLIRIDPEGPANKVRAFRLGFATLMLGRPQEALSWLTQSQAGDPEPAPGAEEDGRLEWTSLLRIGALQLAGEPEKARAAYTAYAAIWPHRTAWRLGQTFTKAQSALPGAAKFFAALVQAGLPAAVDEHADAGVPPTDKITPHRHCEPTPTTIQGAQVIDTAALRRLLAATPPPRILNMSVPSVTLPASIPCDAVPAVAADMKPCLAEAAKHGTGPLVVMGANAHDWLPYNATLALAASGAPVFWYRGGAEAWAGAGQVFTDARRE